MHIYSRNSEDNTGKYPDIVANIPKLVQPSVTGGVVVDCEAVAYDREKDIILPFQAPPPPPPGYCAVRNPLGSFRNARRSFSFPQPQCAPFPSSSCAVTACHS